jgi:hypothetical protein
MAISKNPIVKNACLALDRELGACSFNYKTPHLANHRAIARTAQIPQTKAPSGGAEIISLAEFAEKRKPLSIKATV